MLRAGKGCRGDGGRIERVMARGRNPRIGAVAKWSISRRPSSRAPQDDGPLDATDRVSIGVLGRKLSTRIQPVVSGTPESRTSANYLEIGRDKCSEHTNKPRTSKPLPNFMIVVAPRRKPPGSKTSACQSRKLGAASCLRLRPSTDSTKS